MGVRIAALLALAALVVPASAQAGPGPPLEDFRPESDELGTPPLSDGVRYFVIHRRTGTVRVVDAESKETRDIAMRGACRPVSAHSGLALIVCHDRQWPMLLRLNTMELTRLGGETDTSPQVNPEWDWTLLGRRWIGGVRRDTAGRLAAAWINRKTLRVRRLTDHYPEERDLDDPRLGRADGWRPFTHEPPWVLAGGEARPRRPLILRRGMSPGSGDKRLSPCANGCSAAALSTGLVTWAEPGVVRLYDVRQRIRYGWKAGGSNPPVVHTKHHVLVGDGPLSWARVREGE